MWQFPNPRSHQECSKQLNIPKHKVVVLSGIGCASKISQYIDSYGVKPCTEIITFATGVEACNPEFDGNMLWRRWRRL